jgi:hypothetical protein
MAGPTGRKSTSSVSTSSNGKSAKVDKAYSDALKAAMEPMKKSPSKVRKLNELTEAQINCLDGFGLPPSEIFRSEGWTRAEINDAFKKGNKYVSCWRGKQRALKKDDEERPLSGTLIWYATQRGIVFTAQTSSSEMYSKVPEYMKHGEDCPRMWQVRARTILLVLDCSARKSSV